MRTASLVILLVEDDPGDALIATEALEHATKDHAAHEVIAVGDGQEAIDFLRARVPTSGPRART
jgi:CheY-like chemotaxis protein